MSANQTIIVLISGASGSGKGDVSHLLMSQLKQKDISSVYLSMDNYYKPRPPEITAENLADYQRTKNFDHPDALDLNLLHQHLKMLANEQAIKMPVYSFINSDRTTESIHIVPAKVIIVDGIFALHDVSMLKEIKNLVKIYVEPDSYLDSPKRRAKRDKLTRGRDETQSQNSEIRFVRQAYWRYIAPCKHQANYVIRNSMLLAQENEDITDKVSANISPQLEPVIEDIERKLSKVSTATMSPGR